MFPRLVRSLADKGLLNKEIRRDGYYGSIRFSLLIARYVGLLPISGLHHRTSDMTRFSWKSGYLVMHILNIAVQLSMCCLRFNDIVTNEINPQKLNGFVIRIIVVVSNLFIIRLCTKWEDALKEIKAIEKLLPPIRKHGFLSNCLIIIVYCSSIVEHTFYLLFMIGMTMDCYLLPDDSGLYVKSFFMLSSSWLYDYVPFNYICGYFLQMLKAQGALLWSFIDGLIMIISIYLTRHFNNFNRTMSRKQFKAKNSRPTWSELRAQYTLISRLVAIVDDNINPLVFTSFFSHLFSIIQQLFYMLNKLTRKNVVEYTTCLEDHKRDWESNLYFSFTFMLVVTQLLCISFLASELHTASRESLNALYTVPTSAYDLHMERLMTQIYHSRVCLSGFNLFHITRTMVLTMVATIMTYELVLLQF